MKLAVTSDSQKYTLTLVDTDTDKVLRIGTDKRGWDYNSDNTRPPHRPYGITWSEDKIFIANRANLLIYDSELKFVECIEGVLDQNTHQITYYENQIISTMTRKDCVKFISLEDYSSTSFHPGMGWGSDFPTIDDGSEGWHINGVVVKNNLCHILCYDYILVLNLETKNKEPSISLNGLRTHGIYLSDNIVGTLNTPKNSIILGSEEMSNELWNGHKLRGMAGDECQIAIGNFPNEPNHYEGFGEGYISILENNRITNHYCIDDIGSINDIRRIDGEDFCHHNKYPFPYKNI